MCGRTEGGGKTTGTGMRNVGDAGDEEADQIASGEYALP
jgi:hypothetical protein